MSLPEPMSLADHFCARMSALRDDERGGVSTEYIVILILIAIIGIGAWVSFHDAVRDDADEQYQQFGYPPEE
jgi:Flp pilus assembly pilin Flp